jgi:hypothetical protein
MSEHERADATTRFQAGNALRLTHGARSEPTVKRVATIQKRRLLRQIGLRASDLDGLGLAFLDAWARAQAKVELMDTWFETNGFLEPVSGEPTGPVKIYFTACNTARLAASRLEAHLRAREMKIESPVGVLAAAGRRARLAAVASDG